jgi:glucokinase
MPRRVLAVDLGGTKTATALVDESGQATSERRAPATRSVEETAGHIAAAAEGACGVGVIVPGVYTPATGRAWCPNLWGRDEVPLRDALTARLTVPVAIDSDRAGYVLGEAWLGAARGCRDALFVAIGTGIGVGILSDGRVLRGAHGVAGAAGWFALTPEWRDAYATTGCWEAESAGPALASAAGAADAETVVRAAREGAPDAVAVLQRAARFTAMGIANLVSAFDPVVVVLGGGLGAGAADLLLPIVENEARRWAQPLAMARCRLVGSALGDRAGLLGAARLAWSLLEAEPGHDRDQVSPRTR